MPFILLVCVEEKNMRVRYLFVYTQKIFEKQNSENLFIFCQKSFSLKQTHGEQKHFYESGRKEESEVPSTKASW